MDQKRVVKYDQLVKFAAFIGLVGGLIMILLKVENMLISTLLAFVISYLVGPLVNSLERTGLKRQASIAISFCIAGALLATVGAYFMPLLSDQITSFKSDLPKYISGSSSFFSSLESKANEFIGFEHNIEFDLGLQVQNLLLEGTRSVFEDLPRIISKSLTTLLLAPFFAFFLLRDGQTVVRKILRFVPNSLFELSLNLYHEINDQMGQFVRARLFEAGIVGVVVWLGLFSMSFPYAGLLAGFAAFANLIPYVGPIIGAVPAIGIGLINGEPMTTILMVGLVYFVAQLIDIFFIIPLVVAKIVNLHPVSVVVAIIIGAQLMGVVGMLISIPVASALKVTLHSLYLHLTDFRAT